MIARNILITLAIAATIAPSPATASSQSGIVVYVVADNNGAPGVFSVNGTRTTKPACATDDFWAIANPTTDSAKAMYATILTAQIAGRQVNVVGTGACNSVQTTRENVSFVIEG
jgi:subtilisin family serine protease